MQQNNNTYSIDMLNTIDNSIKNIMRDNKIDQNDIPEIILLITTLMSTNTNNKLSYTDLQIKIEELYEYIMTHYNLYPNDPVQRDSFNRLFQVCIKLVMFQPIVQEKCKKMFKCLN